MRDNVQISFKALILCSAMVFAPATAAFANDAGTTAPLLTVEEKAAETPQENQEAVEQASGTGDIVVTASRRSESITRVPSSITAVTQERMDVQGIKTVADLIRLTPGISFDQGSSANGVGAITIRGLNAAAGAATTGVYIDDVPIQTRVIAYASGSAFPVIFDLERVEVLRGPQGTLFGAGSEGGTVRFIQTKPSLSEWSAYGRAEVSSISSGSNSYEAGLALGGPIIDGVLGFRASAFFRHTGGWIDRVAGKVNVLDATANYGPASISFTPSGVYEEDANYIDATVVRGALTWEPTDALSVTASVYYQDTYSHDIAGSFSPSISDPKNGVFRAVQYLPGVDALHKSVNLGLVYPQKDRFVLPSLGVNWDVGPVTITSTTAYLKRKVDQLSDYNVNHATAYALKPAPETFDYAVSDHHQRQENITQELRAQTNDPSSPLQLVAGLYYEHKKQRSIQGVDTNYLSLRPVVSNAVNGGAPFGPGVSAYINYFGMDPINGTQSYFADFFAVDTQYAAFAQGDWEFVDRLKVTGGIRFSKNKTSFTSIYDGPENNATAPQGRACLPGTFQTGCVPVAIGQYAPGEGPFAPFFNNGTTKQEATAWTPKAGIEFQATPQNMYYASASKGFRPGAAQGVMGAGCSVGLATLGFVDSTGRGASPQTYEPDSVWSYEVGAKNRFFGGRARVNASAFLLKWDNIQSSVFINACNQSFVTNLGKATGKGFDMDLSFDVTSNLTLGTQVGYAIVSYDSATIRGTSTVYTKGSAIPSSGPPWRVTLTGDYNVDLSPDLNGYAHIDYAYTSPQRRTGGTDPGTTSYDRNVFPLPKAEVVNARIGIRKDKIDLSIFASNLLNSTDYLNYSHTRVNYFARTFQPRTIGLSAAYRY